MSNYIFKGRIESLAIGDIPDVKENREVDEAFITRDGIKGDRHNGSTEHSKPWRQGYLPKGIEITNMSSLSMTSTPELEKIAKNMGIDEIQPGWLSENIIVSALTGIGDYEGKNINLSEIPTGARFVIEKLNPEETVVLFVIQTNPPCGIPGKNIQRYFPDQPSLAQSFKLHAEGMRGLILIVEKEGLLKVGDEFKIALPLDIIDIWSSFLKR